MSIVILEYHANPEIAFFLFLALPKPLGNDGQNPPDLQVRFVLIRAFANSRIPTYTNFFLHYGGYGGYGGGRVNL